MSRNYTNWSSLVKVLKYSDVTEKPPCHVLTTSTDVTGFGLASHFGVAHELYK